MSNIIAQDSEFGLFFGGSYYIGDLNSEHFSQQNWSTGGLYRYNFKNERIVFRLNCLYGQVKASDFNGRGNQDNRNLSFRSNILEIGPVFEVNFFPYKLGQSKTDKEKFGTPYFFGGITFFRMEPETQHNGQWESLKPLGTEGQSNKEQYSLTQISMPFGLGVKLNLTKSIAMSLEYGIRKTFTDYLDDVSGEYPADISGVTADLSDKRTESSNNLQRGNPNDKDWYSFWGLIISFKLNSESSCPTWQ